MSMWLVTAAKLGFNLKTMEWMDSKGFTRFDLKAIREVIERRIEECWTEWRKIHG